VPKWVWYSILTMLFWGAWGVVSKAAVDMMSPLVNQVLFTLGLVPLVAVMLRSKDAFAATNRVKGAAYAFATGILGGIGNITFFEALSRGGRASIVVPLTGLYPLLTILAALILLKERLNWVQWAGIAMAAGSIYLFSV